MLPAAPAAFRVDSPRNFSAFTLDIVFFMIGTYFAPTATILVGFANRLTDDPVLIGAVAMAWPVSWYLPQLVAARVVHGKRRQKPYLLWPSLLGRQAFLVLAAWVALTGAAQPVLTIWVMIACIVFFNLCDALAGVAWFDMLSRALSPRLRGRSVAIGQLIGSVLGIGAGLVIQRSLAQDGLPFPQSFAFIFFCAWAAFNVSLVTIFFLQELPMSEGEMQTAHETHFVAHLRESLRDDRTLRQVLLARGLTALEAMAAAFYLVYVTNLLNLPDESVGSFTLANIAGGILGIAAFGLIAERFGPRRVAQVTSFLQFGAPALALTVALAPGLAGIEIAPGLNAAFALFMVILAINGAIGHSLVLGILGYLMDMSAQSRRAIYVGIMNTLGGLIALTPVVGGLLIELISRAAPSNTAYATVFGLVAALVGVGLVLTLRLPRQRPASGGPIE